MKADVINRDIGQRPELRWVPIENIRVDHNYQREVRPARVQQILREFSWDKFGALQLAEQADGTFSAYDGQHRLRAAELHPDVSEVPAVVVLLEGGRDEAGAFLGVNLNRTAVSTIERYWAGIEAGDPDMMAVCAVLEEAKCEVVQAQGLAAPNKTHAVSAISRAIKRYGDASTLYALKVLRAAWPSDKAALRGVLIQAVARIHRGNDRIDRQRLVDVLRATDNARLSADAEAIRKIAGGDAMTGVSKTICELYNRGLTKNVILIGAKA